MLPKIHVLEFILVGYLDLATVFDQLDLLHRVARVFVDHEISFKIVDVIGLQDVSPMLVELFVIAVDIFHFNSLATNLPEYCPVQVRLNWYFLKYGLAQDGAEELE